MTPQSEWARVCKELAMRGEPLTPAEKSTYNSLRAAEMARAEARRAPSPQLELPQQ